MFLWERDLNFQLLIFIVKIGRRSLVQILKVLWFVYHPSLLKTPKNATYLKTFYFMLT